MVNKGADKVSFRRSELALKTRANGSRLPGGRERYRTYAVASSWQLGLRDGGARVCFRSDRWFVCNGLLLVRSYPYRCVMKVDAARIGKFRAASALGGDWWKDTEARRSTAAP